MNNEEHKKLEERYQMLSDEMSILFYKDILAPLMLLGMKRLSIDKMNAWFDGKWLEILDLKYGLPLSNNLYMAMMCKVGSDIVAVSMRNAVIRINMYEYDDQAYHKTLQMYTTGGARLVKRTKIFSTSDTYLHGSDMTPEKYLGIFELYIIPLLKTISETIKSELIRLQNDEERKSDS